METRVIKLNEGLLLALALTLGLASGSGNEIFIIITGDGLTLGELLRASLISLADFLRTKSELLLGLLSKVGGKGLGLVLGFSLSLWIGAGIGILSSCCFLVLLGDGLASFLVGPFGVAGLATPTVSGCRQRAEHQGDHEQAPGRVRKLGLRDMEDALHVIRPSVNRRQLAAYDAWTREYGTA